MVEFKEIRAKEKAFQSEARKQALAFITAGFGLVAGLAWNDAITSLIQYLVPVGKGTIIAKFGYAIVLTIILVLVSMALVRVLGGKDNT